MKYPVSMEDVSDAVIVTRAIYVPEIHSRLVSPQGIETQKLNTVIFGTYDLWMKVETFCTINI